MPTFKNVLNIFSFKKNVKMSQSDKFVATDVFESRYNDAEVLVKYLKTLPDGFKDDQIKIQDLGKELKLNLPRKLTPAEHDAAMTAFENARKDSDMA